MSAAQTAARTVARALRFIRHVITLRSISSALWVMDYENHKPTHGK